MSNEVSANGNRAGNDYFAGAVVFFVTLPVCMGIAVASGAPPASGLIAGIVGGILIGMLSGSQTSVSGPTAGLTAIVASQIALLGSFEQFLMAVVIAGVLQIGLGLIRAGQLSSFAPSSVIKGLIAAVGIILILKQIPHLFGHDSDPAGDMAFLQPDNENTLSEIAALFAVGIHYGATVVGIVSCAILVAWDRVNWLKRLPIPGSLVAVFFGLAMSYWFRSVGGVWHIEQSHRVALPLVNSLADLSQWVRFPDFSGLKNYGVYQAGVLLAVAASLETLLNLDAIDRLDPLNRKSPPNRELLAQGIGNISVGLLGGVPLTAVVVQSSVAISSGSRTRMTVIFHGILLAVGVLTVPWILNLIPIASLAAILLFTGTKLASPALFRQMWSDGPYQFLPFIITVVAIVFTDLFIGVLIGLVVSLGFILNSNFRRPLRTIMEKHIGGDVLRIELANQVSFLNRGAVDRVLEQLKPGDHVMIDATGTDYIDPDVLGLIRDYTQQTAPLRNIKVSLNGFRDRYAFKDDIQYVDYSTRDLQHALTPDQVLQILWEGNKRFRAGKPLHRNVQRQLVSAAEGQHPLAVVLSCIDSRTTSEVIFDLGLGDIFSVRVAGNVISDQIIGSIEYGCGVAGAKLVLVMGHTRCGAVAASVDFANGPQPPSMPNGCSHIGPIVEDIMHSIDMDELHVKLENADRVLKSAYVDETSRRNVLHSVNGILERSHAIRALAQEGRVAVVGAMYNVATGSVDIVHITGAITSTSAFTNDPVAESQV